MLSSLVYTPGVHVKLPVANDLPGTDGPTITIALDANNRLYFANQLVTEGDLKLRLREAVKNSPEPLTLVVQADEAVTHTNLIRLTLLARDAGIRDALLATLPRLIVAPAKP
jgi:biopolymer transport protein ExbD